MYQVEYEFLAAEIDEEMAAQLTAKVEQLLKEDERYKDNEVLALKDASREFAVDVYKYHGTVNCKSRRRKFVLPKIHGLYPAVTKSTIRNLKLKAVRL